MSAGSWVSKALRAVPARNDPDLLAQWEGASSVAAGRSGAVVEKPGEGTLGEGDVRPAA